MALESNATKLNGISKEQTSIQTGFRKVKKGTKRVKKLLLHHSNSVTDIHDTTVEMSGHIHKHVADSTASFSRIDREGSGFRRALASGGLWLLRSLRRRLLIVALTRHCALYTLNEQFRECGVVTTDLFQCLRVLSCSSELVLQTALVQSLLARGSLSRAVLVVR